ncbi:MAG: site-2 protease family protein [Oscillospiraceae bacterium]|nr:site-2 protease family protein [Oscillospiraceae bacterium]
MISDNSGVMFLSFTSILFHELGHIFTMFLLGINIERIRFMPFGIQIDNSKTIKDNQKLLIALSGSIVNFILALLSLIFFDIIEFARLFAGINLVFGIFNLLPILSLDGGVILKIILEKLFDFKVAETILTIISWTFMFSLTSAMCFCFLRLRVKFITLFSFIFVFLSYILNFRDE